MDSIKISSICYAIIFSIVLISIGNNIYIRKKHSIKERKLKGIIDIKDEHLLFYYTKSLHRLDLKTNNIRNAKLLNMNNERLLFEDLQSFKKLLIIIFPSSSCPSCYNTTVLSEVFEKYGIEKIFILTALENVVETHINLCRKHKFTECLAYMDSNLLIDDASDPFLFTWSIDHPDHSILWYFSKNLNRDLLELYLRANWEN